jgi:hypothetical protein
MVTREDRWALKMMADELNVNKETIHHILREDVRKVRPTQTHRRAEATETRIPVSSLDFLFPKLKTAFKGKRFQDVEGIKENVTAELNSVPLEGFA